MKTFEDFLTDNGNEYRLVFNQIDKLFYIHPLNRDGETFDGYVHKFSIHPKKAFDNLFKAIFKRDINDEKPFISADLLNK